MIEEELGRILGRLQEGLEGMRERFDRHDRIHGEMQGDVKHLLKTVHWWKGGMAFGMWAFGVLLGASGVAILLWGTDILAK